MRRLSIIPLAVLAVAPLTRVTAQELPPIKVGDRVRVTAPDVNKYDGTLQAMRGGALTVDTLRITVASVTRLDVHRGRKLSVPGGILGFLGGAVVGGAAAWFAFQDDQGAPTCTNEIPFCPLVIGAVAVGGAAIGALVGRTDRWEEVPLDQLRVSVIPQHDGRFGLGLSFAF